MLTGSAGYVVGQRRLTRTGVVPEGPTKIRLRLVPARWLFCDPGLPDEKEKLMKLLAKKVHRFLVSEDGPTAVEYAVMLALIIIVSLTAISSLGTAARDAFDEVTASVDAAAPGV